MKCSHINAVITMSRSRPGRPTNPVPQPSSRSTSGRATPAAGAVSAPSISNAPSRSASVQHEDDPDSDPGDSITGFLRRGSRALGTIVDPVPPIAAHPRADKDFISTLPRLNKDNLFWTSTTVDTFNVWHHLEQLVRTEFYVRWLLTTTHRTMTIELQNTLSARTSRSSG